MVNSARPARGRFLRVALGVAGVGFLAVLGSCVAGGEARGTLPVLALAALPVLTYLALRKPIVFPFGLYLLLMPFDPLLGLSNGLGATLTKYVGLAAAGALALHAVLARRLLVPPRAWLAWGAVVVLMGASAMWSIDVDHTLPILAIVAQQYLLYTIVALYALTPRDLTATRRAIIAAGTIVSLYGFYAYAAGQRLNGIRLSLSNGHMHFDPNHYAAYLLIPLALLVTTVLLDRRPLHRVLAAALCLLLSANVFLSGSRGGLLALGVVVVYVGLRSRKYLATATLAVAGLGLSFAIPNVWTRVADPTQGEGSGRSEIWNAGLQALRHYWLYGSGFATYPDAYDQSLLHSVQRTFQGWSRPAHNILLQSAVEFGLLGLALVLYAWWTTLRLNKNIPREHPLFAARVATEAAVVGLFCSALTIDVLWFKYLWLGMTLPVMLANVAAPRTLWIPGTRRFRPAPDAPRRLPATATARARF